MLATTIALVCGLGVQFDSPILANNVTVRSEALVRRGASFTRDDSKPERSIVTIWNDDRLTNADLKKLGPLPELFRLSANYATGVSDQGLAELAGSTKLLTLFLGDTAVSGDGLKALVDMKDLQV